MSFASACNETDHKPYSDWKVNCLLKIKNKTEIRLHTHDQRQCVAKLINWIIMSAFGIVFDLIAVKIGFLEGPFLAVSR